MTPIEEFLGYLIDGLEVVTLLFSRITFTISNASFSLLDLTVYSTVITAVLWFIRSHYSGIGSGKEKSVYFKAERKS